MSTSMDPVGSGAHGAPLLDGLNILVVEDSVDNQALYTFILNKAGAKVTIANDGLEGCSLAMESEYDFILMDIRMPGMDGHEAVKMLRLQGFKLPIIAFTAHTMKDARTKALASGFNDFVTKPVDPASLIKLIDQHRTR